MNKHTLHIGAMHGSFWRHKKLGLVKDGHDILRKAAEYGFTCFELGIGRELPSLEPDDVARTRELLKELGLRCCISAGMIKLLGDEPRLRRIFEAARELNALCICGLNLVWCALGAGLVDLPKTLPRRMHLSQCFQFASQRIPVLPKIGKYNYKRRKEADMKYIIPLWCIAIAAAAAQDVTTIEITDHVLVKDAVRLGVNAPGPDWKKYCENFEGTIYRTITRGPVQDAEGITCWWDFEPEIVGADFVILNGPAKGEKGKIAKVSTKKIVDGGQKKEVTYLMFDRPVTPGPDKGQVGIMIERDARDRGYSYDDKQNPGKYKLQQGDVPPGSFGTSAMRLLGSSGTGAYGFRDTSPSAQPGAKKCVRFWAKAVSGAPELTVDLNGAETAPVSPGGEWKQYELTVTLAGDRIPSFVEFNAKNGDVLIDDIETWVDYESKYPNCRVEDAFVDVLKELNPGIIRELQNGGGRVENMINPPLKRIAHEYRFNKPGRKQGYGLTGSSGIVDFYSMCKAVGADPWLCLPGTLYPEEMAKFIEFIAAPPNRGLGKERAAQGHPEPYTKVFKRIYVEIGNEAWNPTGGYARGGYNDGDYWTELYRTARQSPYYDPSIFLIAGSQQQVQGMMRDILDRCPDVHAGSIATYVVHGMTPDWLEPLKTIEDRFRWLFGFTLTSVIEPPEGGGRGMGYIYQQNENCRERGKELTIYEHNYHITKPEEDKGGVPYKERNLLMVSIGGAVNIVNHMMLAMRDAHVRDQCFFTLRQKHFAGVRLWGALEYTYAEHPRPVFYALQLCNGVIGGDLVETRQSGENPTFTSRGVMIGDKKKGKHSVVEGLPSIYSYAFREGKRRGLILVSLDTDQPRKVAPQFDGQVSGGKAILRQLKADKITACNEMDYTDGKVEVPPPERKDISFKSGTLIELPPYSLTAVEWENP